MQIVRTLGSAKEMAFIAKLSSNVLKTAAGTVRRRVHIMQEYSEVYKDQALRRRDKLLELLKEKAEVASKSELARKMRVAKGYYTLEMAPPASSSEIKKLFEDLKLLKDFLKTGCPKHLTVSQALLMVLVAIEVGLWFFLGETIGKFHIVGYDI